MSKITFENVSRIFKGAKGKFTKAVTDLNLTVADKEFMVVVGPSGCGKTTTLRMVAGLDEISEGTISIGETVVNQVPPKERDVAMVFQNYALYPHMTAFGNMAFGLALRKYPKREIRQRVSQAAEMLGLSEDILERKPRELSGGQRQLVALGRAIVRKPKVFLFDEPLSNLDAKLRVQMRTELTTLHKKLEATIIYVTHDQVEAMTMGDRIAIMCQGKIQQVAKPIELYEQPTNLFVAGFIGTPSMNVIEGEVIEKEGCLLFHEIDAHGGPGTLLIPIPPPYIPRVTPLKHRRLILGIRPEHLHPLSEGTAANTEVTNSVSPTIRVSVNQVESTGADTYVHAHTGLHPLTFRTPREIRPETSKLVELGIRTDRIHFFVPADKEPFLKRHSHEFDLEGWQTHCSAI